MRVLPGVYAICRFGPDEDVPPWAFSAASDFTSVTRSCTELSVICAVDALPDTVTYGAAWHCMRIEGNSGLDEPGVLVSAAGPLASAGISVFAIATYDTDHFLVTDIDAAIAALHTAGYEVTPD